MKSAINKRLTHLENKMRWWYADTFFDEWLQEHYNSGVDNFWEILDTIPQEFQLQCLHRAWDQMRKDQNISNENDS